MEWKMDDSRFSKLEDRVDEIKDDVSDLKSETKVQHVMIQELKDDFKEHLFDIKTHITGDEKIISKINPVLNSIVDINEIIADYKFKKEAVSRKKKILKYISINIGILATGLGVVFTLVRLINI